MSLFKYFVTLVISQLFPPPLPHLVSSFNAISMWISTRKKETQSPITRFAFSSFKNSGSFTCLHLKCVFSPVVGLSNHQSKSNGTSEYPNRICCHSRLLLFFLTSLKKNLAHFFLTFCIWFSPFSSKWRWESCGRGLGGGGTNMIKREKKRCW